MQARDHAEDQEAGRRRDGGFATVGQQRGGHRRLIERFVAEPPPVRDRAQAVVAAYQTGLVRPGRATS